MSHEAARYAPVGLLDGAQQPAAAGEGLLLLSRACAGGWGARQRLTQLTHSKKAKVMELEPRGLNGTTCHAWHHIFFSQYTITR